MKDKNILNPDLWVNNYSDALYSYAFLRVNNQELAEDIVQDTFLSAWKAKEGYKGEANEKNWLYAILKNKIFDYYRSKKNIIVESVEEEKMYFDNQEHWTDEASPIGWQVDDTNELNTKEFFSVLKKCKMKLKDIQQQVFSMKYLDEIESDEICKELNITSSNYWVLLHRAKLHLRSCLEKNWINS